MHQTAPDLADAPPHAAYVMGRKRRQGIPFVILCGQPLQAERNTVIHEAPCVNGAAHLQKPGCLACAKQ